MEHNAGQQAAVKVGGSGGSSPDMTLIIVTVVYNLVIQCLCDDQSQGMATLSFLASQNQSAIASLVVWS